MYRLFFIILLSFLWSFSSFAQLHYGVRLGGVLPIMLPSGTDPFTNTEIKFKDYIYQYADRPFYTGLFLGYTFNRSVGFRLDISYADHGFNVEKSITYAGLVETPTAIEIDTREILIEALYRQAFREDVWQLMAGVYYSNFIRSSFRAATPLYFPDLGLDITVNQHADMSPYDFGIVVGSEYHLSKHFFIEVRIRAGIVDMIPNNTLLKITEKSLSVATPAFIKAANNTSGEDSDFIVRLASLSDENGKYLTDASTYRLIFQIGVGWVW